MANKPFDAEVEKPVTPRPAVPGLVKTGKRPRFFRPIYVVPLVAIALVASLWWVNHSEEVPGANMRRGGGGGGRRGQFGNGPLPVIAEPAKTGSISIYVNGLGTVSPLVTDTIRTQISGVLNQVNFQEGQMVKAGDILAVIDPRPYQNSLEQAVGQSLQAQAQLKEAQLDLQRYRTLATQDSIAQQQVDSQAALVTQDEGIVQSDQAAIDTAKLNLLYCHIVAPVTGRVGLRQVDPGNYVTPGDSNGIVVLTQTKPISVVFTLPEDDVTEVAARIRAGSTVPIDAFDRTQSKKLASGKLETIDNEVDPTTGTFKLRAIFANEDDVLFPNQFVNVRMLLDVRRDVTVIPTSAIERSEQGTYVYVIKSDNTATVRPVTLGATEGESVEVLSGLDLGELVVTDGADKLKEGMDVIVQAPANAIPSTGAIDQPKRKHKKKDGSAGGGGFGGGTGGGDGKQ